MAGVIAGAADDGGIILRHLAIQIAGKLAKRLVSGRTNHAGRQKSHTARRGILEAELEIGTCSLVWRHLLGD
ncbi:hypothetical protein BST21_23815 [Mycolicibacterium celeriflavum]|nr:hypothetical protein BST21_23815 [Mycolicibacterium celeriflavum]